MSPDKDKLLNLLADKDRLGAECFPGFNKYAVPPTILMFEKRKYMFAMYRWDSHTDFEYINRPEERKAEDARAAPLPLVVFR